MSDRLYFDDCYVKQFHSVIKVIHPKGVVLDTTAFYPESGGQLGDRGELTIDSKTFQVKNTYEKRGQIIHEIENLEGIKVGETVQGTLDWDRRLQLMKMHTAQHCISRFFQLNYSAETVSNQLGLHQSRLDFFPLPKLGDKLEELTARINDTISAGMTVTFSFLPRKKAISFLKAKKYQIKYLEMVPKHVREFRIVAIGDYDFAACAGTHVRNTGDVGNVILEKTVNKGRDRERIYYSLTNIDRLF